MKISDGKRTVEIKMQMWNGSGYDPDWSADFFEAGDLDYDEEHDVCVVDDVDEYIDAANDWKNGINRFNEPEENDIDNRFVFVEEISL